MDRYVSVGRAAGMLGVSVSTLRRWEREGKLMPERTASGHRRYALSQLQPGHDGEAAAQKRTIAYARVSSHDQKADLERQKKILELYCARQGWTHEVIADLGSGMNYRKKGLKRLLEDIMAGRVGRLVLTHKDRLLRFGAELVFALCEARQVEVVILNQGRQTTVLLLVQDQTPRKKTNLPNLTKNYLALPGLGSSVTASMY